MVCRHASYRSGVAAGHAAEGKPKTRLASSRRGARNAPILRFPISYGELFEHCYVFFGVEGDRLNCLTWQAIERSKEIHDESCLRALN